MPYEYTEGQKRFLRQRAIELKELDDCCTCTGDCDDIDCIGFTRACLCDKDWKGINGNRQARTAIQPQRSRQQLGTHQPAGDTDRTGQETDTPQPEGQA